MKLSYALIGLAAASVMPTASALESSDAQLSPAGTPFALEINATHAPTNVQHVGYPHAAGTRNVNGHCSVSFDVAATGTPTNINVLSCSSEMFRKEAARTVQGLEFSAGAKSATKATIAWTIAPETTLLAYAE